jgi:glucosamine 6-phosphate synthetase-like amidotransferase/phosphosugar isomerase protein
MSCLLATSREGADTHIRAAIGSAVQQSNCHPFRHGRWLWMHNGYIDGFATIKRDLAVAACFTGHLVPRLPQGSLSS